MSTDTQPTKFCVECKHYDGFFMGPLLCLAPQREKATDMVTGAPIYVNGDNARYIRENECHGEWWEEMPKPEPEPEESRYVFFDDKPIGRYTPSLIQRIKRWFKW